MLCRVSFVLGHSLYYTECGYAECHLCWVTVSIIPSVAMLSVDMLIVDMQSFVNWERGRERERERGGDRENVCERE